MVNEGERVNSLFKVVKYLVFDCFDVLVVAVWFETLVAAVVFEAFVLSVASPTAESAPPVGTGLDLVEADMDDAVFGRFEVIVDFELFFNDNQ